MSKPHYKRIMLKLSGEVFGNREHGHSLDAQVLAKVASQLIEVSEMGVEISMVVGGGNIFRGLAGEQAGIMRSQGDYMGMLATVINALALQSALEKAGAETRVMTAISMENVAEPFIRRRAIRHLEKGRIVIFGAGTGNPYFTTDSAAALRASEIDAEVMLKGTKVDGVYDSDPSTNPDAVRYDKLSYTEAISRDLQVMDTSAFSLCRENGIPIIVFDFFKDHELRRVMEGESVGTLITKGC
jgi:uridylate kinase